MEDKKQDKNKTRESEELKVKRGIAQSGSASALGAEGRGFKSLCPDHSNSARSSIINEML